MTYNRLIRMMAKDTKPAEESAENLIAHKLLEAEILVAKPKFDQEGADLLGLLTVKDGARFCRIQSKNRSLIKWKRQEVKIPQSYATNPFVAFVYVKARGNSNLYCFLGREIREKWTLRKGNYVLVLTAKRLADLAPYHFTDTRADEIKKLIEGISKEDQKREFGLIVGGVAELRVGAATMQGFAGMQSPEAYEVHAHLKAPAAKLG